ncbi:amidase [Nocardioides massiliensis]|uniref:Amidase n=1 Tax=Nocardioides massiliensis TaxID=1325935 RepID=A0ABT9NVR5_9ACTN|nr:amidase [Nocardioides massiliensis]MDP9824249.1 amidase [Nocardioides massiliensis]
MSSDITCFSTAREMAAAVAARRISARELLELHLERIDAVNGDVNALVSIDPDRARAAADEADARTMSGAPLGPLHGLPYAVKDTHEVADWRTTFGSVLFADHRPAHDELVVQRVREAGAVIVAKSNVPEFAAGSHTFNRIFGTTLNPWDASRSAGGSSGGSAAALASGMVPLADGSDMGGSLRNPASFCNVVGMRPSFGRVPQLPNPNIFETTSVQGPMARNVEDLALLLSVLAGPVAGNPAGHETPGESFARVDQVELAGMRFALSVDLDGAFEVDRQVAEIVTAQGAVLESLGASVESAAPDLREAEDTFRTLRAWHFQASYGELLAAHEGEFKASLADNIRVGEDLTGRDVARAYRQRTALAQRMVRFFETYDALVLPVSQVPPFPADQEYPADINGQEQATYLDWMRSAYFVTVTGCPAISVPAGFTAEGWPVGLQIVVRPNDERRLLAIARAFEAATRVGENRPTLG